MGKRQHYVPQFWVKQYFGRKEGIFENGQRINIKNHRYKNHLYSLDEETSKQVNQFAIEEYFSKVEDAFAKFMIKHTTLECATEFIAYEKWGRLLTNRSPRKLSINKILEDIATNPETNILDRLSKLNSHENNYRLAKTWFATEKINNDVGRQNSSSEYKERHCILKFPIDMPLPNESIMNLIYYDSIEKDGSITFLGNKNEHGKIQIILINKNTWVLKHSFKPIKILDANVQNQDELKIEIEELKVSEELSKKISWAITRSEHLTNSTQQMVKRNNEIFYFDPKPQVLGGEVKLISMKEFPELAISKKFFFSLEKYIDENATKKFITMMTEEIQRDFEKVSKVIEHIDIDFKPEN